MLPEEFIRIDSELRARGLTLTENQAQAIVDYVALLMRWNRRMNLVGASTVATIYARHIFDCLILGTLPWPAQTQDIIDMGSGAGLPGLMIALLHPECRVISVDRVAKKISFQQVARDALGLENFHPLRADVRNLPVDAPTQGVELPKQYDLAVVRAFASLEVLMPIAAQLLRPRGVLWAMKGRRLEVEQSQIPESVQREFDPRPAVHCYDVAKIGAGGRVAAYCRTGEKS